jgi:biotin carboxyl carrier protein
MKRLLPSLPGLAVLAACLLLSAPLYAGPGHDHDEPTAAAPSNAPKRLPDGSVFLPKPAQRQLDVRTVRVQREALPRTAELAGRVMMDPNAGGRVQSSIPGRLEAGPKGLPGIGQSVRKGEVLAYVMPTSGSIERSNQVAQLADLRSAKSLAERRLARLRQLEDTVARRDLEAAEADVASLTERIAALGAGLSNRESLVAPVSGVIASANAVAGQLVDARELVFEVVDPMRLRIEAVAYDPALASDVGGASLAVGDRRVPLTFLGAARTLREQALPMSFAADGSALRELAVGQPVRFYVQSKSRVEGIPVPAGSLVRNPSNQTIVWVKARTERFEPRVVTTEPLDGTQVAVVGGLQPGERVVTRGATLVNQVR